MGFKQPDPNYYEDGSHKKVLAGCILFIVVGGVLRVVFARWASERSHRKRDEMHAKIRADMESEREFAANFATKKEFHEALKQRREEERNEYRWTARP